MIILNAAELIKAVEIIDKVPGRSGITPSEFVQLEKKKDKVYFSLASEVYGRTFVKIKETDDKDWLFHIDRTSLFPFVLASKTFNSKADFKLELSGEKDNKRLTIRCGRRKVVFNAITFVQGYPKYMAESSVTLPLSKKQKQLLLIAKRYATSDPTLGYINCVFMLSKHAVLSSNRVSLFYGRDDSFPLSVPLPLLLLDMLDTDDLKAIEVSKKAIKLAFNNGYICQSINMIAKKDFPFEQSLKQFKRGDSYPTVIKVRANKLIEAVSRIGTYVSSINAPGMLVIVKGNKKETKLYLYCDTPQGRFTETVETLSKAKQDIKCEWLLSSLTPLGDCLDLFKKIEVKFDDEAKSPFHFVTDNDIQIMLSRRV